MLVTVTLFILLVLSMIAAVVAAFDHRYPVPPEAVSTTDPPWQNVVGPLGVITGTGNGFNVTSRELSVPLPQGFVPVTEMSPVTALRA